MNSRANKQKRLEKQRMFLRSKGTFIVALGLLPQSGSSTGAYTLQHKLPLYSEAKWWTHMPAISELPGSELANYTAISLPMFTSDVPELVDQYVKAFEKVWAHRRELGRS
jgi:hypothetical protein